MNWRLPLYLSLLAALLIGGAVFYLRMNEGVAAPAAHQLWAVPFNGSYRGIEADEEGNIYCMDFQGQLISFDRLGKQRFSRTAAFVSPFQSSVQLTSAGKLLTCTDRVVSLLEKDGSPIWEKPMPEGVDEVYECGGRLFGTRDSTRLLALDEELAVRWDFLTGGYIQPLQHGGEQDQYYLQSGDGNVYCLLPEGELRWHKPGWCSDDAVFPNGDLLLETNMNATVRLSVEGEELWSLVDSERQDAKVLGDGHCVLLAENEMRLIDANGDALWKRRVGGEWSRFICFGPDSVYLLEWVEPVTGWRSIFKRSQSSSQQGGAMGALQMTPEVRLQAIGLDGKVRWSYGVPGGGYSEGAPGPDNSIYMQDGSNLVRIGR